MFTYSKENTKEEKTLPLKFKSRTQRSILIAIFFVFLALGLNRTKWEGSYIQDWNKLDVDFMSTKRGTESPYIQSLGNIDSDPYPELLLHDGPEKTIAANSSESYQFLVNSLDIVYESINILDSQNYFSYYGQSSIASYSLKGVADTPSLNWSRNIINLDILNCKVIKSIDEDDVKDVFFSVGNLKQLPDLNVLGFNNYIDLFKSYPTLFINYFIIDKYNTTILITPNYDDYGFMILSGKNGSLIARSDISGLDSSMCIIDLIELNKTSTIHTPYQTDFVLLCANISRTRLIGSDTFGKDANRLILEYHIKGLSTNPLAYTWNKKSSDLDSTDMIPLPLNIITQYGYEASGNTSLKYANNVGIEASGENFIIRYSASNATIKYNLGLFEWLPIPICNIFMVYNGTTGEKLWHGDINTLYLSRNIDLKGSGMGQINSYYVDEFGDLYFVLHDAKTGNLMCKAKLNYNENRLINNNTIMDTRMLLTVDDAIGNDGFLEIYIVAVNRSYLEQWKDGIWQGSGPEIPYESKDPIQIARINLNDTWGVSMVISPIYYENINLKRAFSLGWFISDTNVDFDDDGIVDYLLHSNDKVQRIMGETTNRIPRIAALSGLGMQMHARKFDSAFSTYVSTQKSGMIIDYRKFDEIVYFFHDPINEKRVSSISANPKELIYIQDLNTFAPQETIQQFFLGAEFLMYGLWGCVALFVMLAFTGIKMEKEQRSQEELEIENKHKKGTSKVLLFCILLAIFTIVVIEYFFTYSIDLSIGYTDVAVSAEGQLLWFLILYPAIFLMMALIPDLYNKLAPYFAHNVFIKTQRKFYNYFMKTGKKDYRVIIINMVEKDKVSSVKRISRILLPLLISLTIGITIYQGLGEDGWLYNALSRFIDHPLTNPSVLGILTEEMTNANDLWVEIGKFARYCVLPMIITYALISLFIPSSWLLDDAGVCYYQQALKYREISDVDSISKWSLGFISGLFGFTALISFFGLFLPMLNQLDTLGQNLSLLAEDVPPALGIAVLILALIIFPILVGILLMLTAQIKMERNYFENVERLYQLMEKDGITTVPHDLTSVLKAELPDQHFTKHIRERLNRENIENGAKIENKPKGKNIDFEEKYDRYMK